VPPAGSWDAKSAAAPGGCARLPAPW
jgi:hypothetical protein